MSDCHSLHPPPMAALTPRRVLHREHVALQCGVPDCVCERERLDVHAQEPKLPDGCVCAMSPQS